MPRIQPGAEIGPNNAGKMILRGCFMDVSQDWLESSGQVGGVLSRYLNNRHGEATPISLNHGHSVPRGREDGPYPADINFMASVVFRLGGLEKRGDALQHATAQDIKNQVTAQVKVLEEEIDRYMDRCVEDGIAPMFTGVSDVIIENVKSRTAVTHTESLTWEPVGGELDLFAGLTVNYGDGSQKVHDDAPRKDHDDSGSGYVPPTFP